MNEQKNILGGLIVAATLMAYETGSGEAEDEEYKTGLAVQADWVECENNPGMTELHITIFQDDIALVIYNEPGTACPA